MTPEQFSKLTVGDLVRHKHHANAYVIVRTHPIVGIDSRIIANPSEWDVVDHIGRVLPIVSKLTPADFGRKE